MDHRPARRRVRGSTARTRAAPTATLWKGELAMPTAQAPELSTYRWSSHDEADRFPVGDFYQRPASPPWQVVNYAGHWPPI